MEDLNGHSLLKKYDPDVSGSPFINDKWELAKITLIKGKEVGPLLIKLNIVSNELYFIDSLGKEMIALDGLVKKIDCINYYSKDSIRYVFKNGYPGIDNQAENFYYQVYTEGKVELLAKKIKYIRTIKDQVTGEIIKDFVESATTLFVYSFDNIQPFKANKDFILSLLIDKEDAINDFMKSYRINLRKTSDLITLFNYYNKL
jgi:hypothetical protein